MTKSTIKPEQWKNEYIRTEMENQELRAALKDMHRAYGDIAYPLDRLVENQSLDLDALDSLDHIFGALKDGGKAYGRAQSIGEDPKSFDDLPF